MGHTDYLRAAMNLFSIWPRFGFINNPYDNNNLPGDEVGNKLLVGRDVEIDRISRRVGSGGTHPSVEGPAGVGKSSLLAVAGYRMMQQCLSAQDGTLFVPTGHFFQATESVEEFEADVYREVAQTLIRNVEAFRRVGLEVPDVSAIDKWLNDAEYRSYQGQLSGIGGGRGSEPNTAAGFLESGFPAAVRMELERLFPEPGAGGVICVLDNLELLQTSGQARDVLEELRDRVFNLPGLRWVLCGSRGIVSRARSQRLSGVFEVPLILGPLPVDASDDLIARRIDHYSMADCYPPVTPQSFEFLYRALNHNLRDALAYAQQFSDWLYDEYVKTDRELPPHHETDSMLQVWLAEQADRAKDEAGGVQRRQWQFFDQLAKNGGSTGASEWEAYGFTTQQQFSAAVTALVTANVVVRETDPDNASRSIATITPQGWLVFFNRNRYDLPSFEDA